MMKIFFKVLLIFILIGAGISCEEQLMEKPLSNLAPENFYNNGEEGINSVNACYQSMKDNFISRSYGINMFLDNSNDFNNGAARQFGEFHNSTLSSNNTHIINMWTRFYTTIGACNITIGRMENSDIEDEIKNRIIGEAKFIRALNYFYLVRLWGPVPLKTDLPEGSDVMDIPRTSIQDIYQTIIDDLTYSEVNCWDVGESRTVGSETFTNDLGRATRGAAKALLAKVYLKIASTAKTASRRQDAPLINSHTGQVDAIETYKNFNAEDYYDLCIEKCNEVEALGFELNADYMTNFNLNNKNGIESLFEIQAHGELDYGSRLAAFYSPPYSGLYGGTWGGTHGVLRNFLLNKGPFKIFKNADFDYRPAVEEDNNAETTLFPLDITDYRYQNGFVHDWVRLNQNNRPYRWDAGSARYIGTPAGQDLKLYTSKYVDTNGTIHDDNSNNWVLLRFADVLLMKAECLFEKGQLEDAWELITRVHTRNGNQNVGADNLFPNNYTDWISQFPGSTLEDQYREAILYERFMELFYEGHRYFDLCRLGLLEEKCAIVGRPKTRKSYYYPISQIEINTNDAISELDNNPGYETVED
jgi:starch-binding outer membrane protein, SusD/RagB family